MIAATEILPSNDVPLWSAEETVSRQRDGSTLWQIEAQCNEHCILAWGRTRSQAWKAATRMAERIRKQR